MLTFRFHGADGRMIAEEKVTTGMIGKKVKLEFSQEWMRLRKTAVFTAGQVTRDVVDVSDVVTIPAEVLRNPMERLYVGVYGVSADGKIVIPTVRAMGPVIMPGIDPSGDTESTDPALPVWAQLQSEVNNVREELEAVGSGGHYTPVVTQPDTQTMEFAFIPSTADLPAIEPVQITLPGGNAQSAADGEDGGYYTVTIEQISDSVVCFHFIPSSAGMEAVPDQTITLPAGIQGEQGLHGEPGLSAYYSSEDVPDCSTSMDYAVSLIETSGREIQAGDFIINVHGELYRVTSVSSETAMADYLMALKGETGEKGPAGYSPVRGTDYWTDADKEEIKAYVDNAILGGAW